MTYKTHLSAGVLFSTIYFLNIERVYYSPAILILLIPTMLGASVPDLDTPSSELWDKIPAGSLIGRIVNPVFIGGHRHLSHSFLGMALFTAFFSLLLKIVLPYLSSSLIPHSSLLIAFILGYASHLFADMFTETGVPLLFPLGYHFGLPPLKKIRIKTGHWFENLIIYPAVNIAIIIAIYRWAVKI